MTKCNFCVEKPFLQQQKRLYLFYLTIVLVGIFMTHLPQTIHQTVTTRKSFLSPLLFEETFALFSILLYFFSVASEGKKIQYLNSSQNFENKIESTKAINKISKNYQINHQKTPKINILCWMTRNVDQEILNPKSSVCPTSLQQNNFKKRYTY